MTFLGEERGTIQYKIHYILVNLIDVTLACEDANSKLVEAVTVADVDAEKRVDDSLVQIWKMKLGQKVKFLVYGFSPFLCVINSCMIIDSPHPCSCLTIISFFFFSFYWWPLPLSSPPLRSPYTPMPHRLSSRARKKPQKQTNSFPIDFFPLEI